MFQDYTGTVLGAENTTVNKTLKSFCPHKVYSPTYKWWMEKDNFKKGIKYVIYYMVINAMEEKETRKGNRVYWVRGFSLEIL